MEIAVGALLASNVVLFVALTAYVVHSERQWRDDNVAFVKLLSNVATLRAQQQTQAETISFILDSVCPDDDDDSSLFPKFSEN